MAATETYRIDPAYIASYNSLLRTRIDEFLREKLREAGYGELAPSHGAVLSIVYKNGGRVQVKTICEVLRKGRPTITEQVNRLVRLGYLEKCTCSEDGRSVYVAATQKAEDFYEDFGRISQELQGTILKGFSKEEADQLALLLNKSFENFDG